MTGLVLAAASGLAREVLAVEELLGRFDDVVVLDDDPAVWGNEVAGHPVVGPTSMVDAYPEHRVLVCAGRGAARHSIVTRLAAHGVTPDRYATTVHPDVRVPSSCTVGAGSVLLAGVVLTADVTLGDHVVVMPHVTLTHDVVVDDFATLCAQVALAGGVHVGAGAYLGTASSVRERVQVGADALLGMGAVLVRDLPAAETWVGVPARPVRTPVEVQR